MANGFRFYFYFLLAPLVFALPSSAFGAVIFTEVMYDVPGTDTGREWIEIQNTGSQTVDLSGWKFFEANTAHALTLSQGAGIPPGGFAIIADTPSKFLADWPAFSGTMFDSSFSLSNSGESLVLRDDTGADEAALAYDPTLGAAGDGNTLQWNGSKWLAASATPGSGYSTSESSEPPSGTSDNSGTQTPAHTTENQAVGSPPVPKSVFADAGPDRTVFVGADSPFTASAIGLSGEPLEGGRYVWNFGDGGVLEGPSVQYHYSYPGTYTVVLDVSSGRYDASDRIEVHAIPALVSIVSVADGFVSIRNGSAAELDLGGWGLTADGKTFTFPPHTIVAPGETVVFSDARTGVTPSTPQALSLLYPNGAFAASLDVPLVAARYQGDASLPGGAPRAEPARGENLIQNPPPAPDASAGEVLGAELDASSGNANHGSSVLPWVSALAFIVALGAGALFFFTGKSAGAAPAPAENAFAYDIEEIKD